MRTRIGLSLTAHEVRGVLVRDGRICGQSCREMSEAGAIRGVIQDLLGGRQRRRLFVRHDLVATLSHSVGSVKRLSGIPAGASDRSVAELLRLNPGRFIVGGEASALTVSYRSEAGWWAATTRGSTIAALQQACNETGVRLVGVTPEVAALPLLSADGVLECREDDASFSVTVRQRRFVSVVRGAAGSVRISDAAVAGPGPEYAAAIAAAQTRPSNPLFILVSQHTAIHRRRIRKALVAACATAAVAAMVAPGLSATWRLGRDSRQLDSLNAHSADWTASAEKLQRASRGLATIDRFVRRRQSALSVLGQIAAALPDSTAVVQFTMDTAAVALTALSNSAPRMLSQLSALAAFDQPRITGAVSREIVEGLRVQRTAMRMRFAGRSARGNSQ